MTASGGSPARLVVYKEIVDGDLRKLIAESNDSSTGGGARDLRLSAKAFRPMMNRIFTESGVGRGGQIIRYANVLYSDAHGGSHTTRIEYWPPTKSRPSEDRVARVHASPAIGGRLPSVDKGKVFILFIRFENGTVQCEYAYEQDLQQGLWSAEVSQPILRCVRDIALKNARRANPLTVAGYIDFTDGTDYCHAN